MQLFDQLARNFEFFCYFTQAAIFGEQYETMLSRSHSYKSVTERILAWITRTLACPAILDLYTRRKFSDKTILIIRPIAGLSPVRDTPNRRRRGQSLGVYGLERF